jgi:hypothetical protein
MSSCSESLSTTANGLLADCKVAGCLEISTFQSDPSYTVHYKGNTKRYQVFFYLQQMKAVFGFLLLGLVGEHRQLLQKNR